MNKSQKVLIVDDEPDILELLEYNLLKEGYEVQQASDGLQALDKLKTFVADIIILDVMMPKIDGIETCRRIRQIEEYKNTYILFLTSRSEEFSEIAAFDVGASDYLTKPVKPRALLSRISAHLRREQKNTEQKKTISISNLVIDKESYTVVKGAEKIVLPRKEFELLYFLAANPHKVFNRDELLRNIWGQDVYVVARTVDVHIRKVREKIGENYITTIKGIGYKFNTYNI